MGSRRRITLALVGLVVLVVVGWFVREAVTSPSQPDPAPTSASSAPAPSSAPSAPNGMATKPLSSLPPEAAATWKLIQKGGPFPSDRDGITFRNAEKLLPIKPDGYYREYTVPTPGASTRGTRRLIYSQQRELYYTGDHYASFVLVDPSK